MKSGVTLTRDERHDFERSERRPCYCQQNVCAIAGLSL